MHYVRQRMMVTYFSYKCSGVPIVALHCFYEAHGTTVCTNASAHYGNATRRRFLSKARLNTEKLFIRLVFSATRNHNGTRPHPTGFQEAILKKFLSHAGLMKLDGGAHPLNLADQCSPPFIRQPLTLFTEVVLRFGWQGIKERTQRSMVPSTS